MLKQTVFLTGATGGMGFLGFQEMLADIDRQNIILLVQDTARARRQLRPFLSLQGLTVIWGDLTRYDDVYRCVKEADLILHVAALVSPAADYHPRLAMQVNYGGMQNILRAIAALNKTETVKLAYIGTVAETGDRMPPIHWGRVGDPVKPSVFDYYAVSKVAAERLLIESGLRFWVSLRQTGIMGPAMSKIRDAIMFHNGLNNVLEYVSDRDSGRLLGNLARLESTGALPEAFWGHIYNIGGGERCRVDTYTMLMNLYRAIGFTDLDGVLDPRWFATRNFHGQYYLDSDVLESYLHFRRDSMQYFYDAYQRSLGAKTPIFRTICKLPGGQGLLGKCVKYGLRRIAGGEHGTLRFIRRGMREQIDACWGSRQNWEALPSDMHAFQRFTEWDTVIRLDHGYDESKPRAELNLNDIRQAAAFRGGKCLSAAMQAGDWKSKLQFRCAFGHTFSASPLLVLEGGHWCPDCERKSWNYAARAGVDPFFTQVWNPLHTADEPQREVAKVISELDV